MVVPSLVAKPGVGKCGRIPGAGGEARRREGAAVHLEGNGQRFSLCCL